MTVVALVLFCTGSKNLNQWGAETLDMIRHDYFMPRQKLYGESISPVQRPMQAAFNWGAGVLLSAMAAGARQNERFEPWLREYADSSRCYWNTKGPMPGYDVLPGPKAVDRYYDDNAWMVMALCETYSILKSPRYLDWAKVTLSYVLSGEDAKLGGGIYWRERPRNSKNTCSNGPSAAACLAVYDLTGEKRLLEKAAELYSWTQGRLQDPSDHLFWDNITLDGRVEETKWSYNTALMIRTAARLFQVTGLPSYKEEATMMIAASKRRWLRDGKLHDEGKFVHLLLESWIFAGRSIPNLPISLKELSAPLTYLRTTRTSSGHYPRQWSGGPARKAVAMIDQASFARACFMVSEGI
jgi:hypothetical protein